MKRGLIIFGFCFILIAIASVSALPLCVQGGYMDALDCSYDSYSCQYAPRCLYNYEIQSCLSGPCSVANFDEYSCKTTCSVSYATGVKTCYNCVWDSMTGMCNQAEQCDNGNGTFCLPGLRKCGGAGNGLRQFCNGAWTTEENCSSTKMGVCTAVYNFGTSTIDTSCIECDSDADGFVPYRYSSLCPLCSGLECDCNDSNSLINPGKTENCTNGIDDNCDELVDNADPDCNQSVFTCSDSDNGNNIYVKGFILGTNFIFVDSCNNTSGLLTEYFCVGNNYSSSALACPAGYLCQNGACNQTGFDNQSNVTNCTLEGQFITNLACCPGLSEFKMPDAPENFCDLSSESESSGFLNAFLGLFRKSMTGNTIFTEQVLCYDSTKGTPVCMNSGNSTEGLYYSGTSGLLMLGGCSSTCIEHICIGNRISCSHCGASFRTSWDAFKVSVQKSPPPSVKEMNVSQVLIDFLKGFESFNQSRYLCPARQPTIGYGHVILRRDKIGNRSLWDATITRAEAEEILRKDIKIAEDAVRNNVKVELTQAQFDALVSFTFNAGVNAFKKSTLLKYLNIGDYQKAANEFPKWVNATVKGKKVTLRGLVRRRADEKKMFESVELLNLTGGNMLAFNRTHIIELYTYNKVTIGNFSIPEWRSLSQINSSLIISSKRISQAELNAMINAKTVPSPPPVPPTPPEEPDDGGVG